MKTPLIIIDESGSISAFETIHAAQVSIESPDIPDNTAYDAEGYLLQIIPAPASVHSIMLKDTEPRVDHSAELREEIIAYFAQRTGLPEIWFYRASLSLEELISELNIHKQKGLPNMQTRKIGTRIFIAAILLAIVAAIGVVSVWGAGDEKSKSGGSTSFQQSITNLYGPLSVGNFLVEANSNSAQSLVVHIHGLLPDNCYRLRNGIVHYQKQEIRITLYSGFRANYGYACLQLGTYINVAVPIDVAALAPGDYTLNVMGQTQTVTITPEMQAAALAFNAEPSGIDITRIEYVAFSEIAGQPALKIDGHFTVDCPYIIGVIQHTEGYHISVIPKAGNVCGNPYLPETMPLDIPLDLAGLPLGKYTLTVGDQSLKFDLNAAPTPPRILPASEPPITEPPADPFWLPVN